MALLTLVAAPCIVQAQGYGYGYGYGRPPSAVRVGIVRALYGTRGHYIDVTRIVRRYASRGARMEVSNETFGIDPYKGKGKRLRVIFSGPNGSHERSWSEGDTVRFW